ncbi:Hypothetical predicted protein [Mytilus galloprovincialis]|uniref:Exonuclease domain-containing protein n=1 Tax=Mytilus galloprovincialis TaxID=29158 RepID=A0A8B6BXZ8_MYTGA|nr:Hypothetical predicted protein [Mytilus galloprovincialis]
MQKEKKRKQTSNRKENKKRRISLKKKKNLNERKTPLKRDPLMRHNLEDFLKERKKNLNERKNCVKEGPTYETQLEMNIDDTVNLSQIPQQIIISGTESKVFFDLETTGLGRNSDITQIAAQNGDNVFQRYIIPMVDLQIETNRVTGITYSQSTNIMYVHGEKVEPVSIQKAMSDFLEFLICFRKTYFNWSQYL